MTWLLIAIAVAALASFLAACGGSESPAASDGASTGIAASASPAEVVTSYLAALQSGDGDTAQALSSERFAEETDQAADSWLHQAVTFADVSVGAAQGADGSATASRYADAIYIPVTFDLTQANPQSLPNGPTVWGFTLGRNGPDEAWEIDGAGNA